MTQNEKHTPEPWSKGNLVTHTDDLGALGIGKPVEYYYITGPDGRTVTTVGLWFDKIEEQKANADLIIKTPTIAKELEETKLMFRNRVDMWQQKETALRNRTQELEEALGKLYAFWLQYVDTPDELIEFNRDIETTLSP